MGKRSYGIYNKFDVVYADFGRNPHGVEGGVRPGVIISCDASNHDKAPQVSVVPLSTKLKSIPVHVVLEPKDVSGFGLSKKSDFMPEDARNGGSRKTRRALTVDQQRKFMEYVAKNPFFYHWYPFFVFND